GQITRLEIEDWRREKLSSCRPSSVNRECARLRAIFRKAVEWDILEKSPMEKLKFFKEHARTRFLTVEECERLIHACIAPHIRNLVVSALRTGLRQSELFNLRWRDVDFSTGLILVADSKNGESRHVPMDDTVRALLASIPHRQPEDWVFSNSSGQRLRDIRCGFQNAVKRAGLSNLRFHDLRHCFASRWVQEGGNLYVLKALLEHKTITITELLTPIAG